MVVVIGRRAVAIVETVLASRVADGADGVAVDEEAVAAVREMAPWGRLLTAIPKAVAVSASTPSRRLAARYMVIVAGRWPTGTIIRQRRVKVGMSLMTTRA